jgi:hypothetical protein
VRPANRLDQIQVEPGLVTGAQHRSQRLERGVEPVVEITRDSMAVRNHLPGFADVGRRAGMPGLEQIEQPLTTRANVVDVPELNFELESGNRREQQSVSMIRIEDRIEDPADLVSIIGGLKLVDQQTGEVDQDLGIIAVQPQRDPVASFGCESMPAGLVDVAEVDQTRHQSIGASSQHISSHGLALKHESAVKVFQTPQPRGRDLIEVRTPGAGHRLADRLQHVARNVEPHRGLLELFAAHDQCFCSLEIGPKTPLSIPGELGESARLLEVEHGELVFAVLRVGPPTPQVQLRAIGRGPGGFQRRVASLDHLRMLAFSFAGFDRLGHE